MKYRLLLLMFLLSIATFAQKNSANPKTFASSITDSDLKKHLAIVASKEMEGRETATEGQRKAATYIESVFKSLGLQPGNQASYQLPYSVYRDSLIASRMVINGKDLVVNQDFQPVLSYSNTSSLYFSEISFAGYGLNDSTHNSYGTGNVRGKAVIILEGAPDDFMKAKGFFAATTLAKVAAAREKGASAVLVVVNSFRTTSQGNMYINIFKDAQYPATYLISSRTAELLVGDSWAAMKDKVKADKKEPISVKTELQLDLLEKVQKLQSSNVLGVLEGTDKKNEYLVITAHYDHLGKRGETVFYGADDDGSGTVGVLEIAEAFVKAKAAGKGPRRSILFMTVSGEEKGLWGSQYYSTHPTIDPALITADLNIDMIGRVDTERKKADTLNYVYVVGDDKLSTELKPLSEAVNNKYTKLFLDYKFNDPKDTQRIYFRSDHYNFAKIGIPIIFYYDGMLKGDYHKATDTVEKINYQLMAKRAQLVFYTAWEMANREAMMKRDIPLPKMER